MFPCPYDLSPFSPILPLKRPTKETTPPMRIPILFLALSLTCTSSFSATASKPNFVVIFADDLGYGDLGCYGQKVIRTPNLDRMASEGLRMTNFYSCAPVCTPSRAGLLTGRYPIRSGLTRVLFPHSTSGIEDSETTIAELLKDQGYSTACIGKWHLGHLPPHLPTRHGFDYYFGIPYSNDMHVESRGDPPVPLMRGEEIIEQPVDQTTVTKRYAEEAAQFIGRHKDEPFFIYLPHTMPHVPLFVSKDFEGRSPRGLYGDVIEEIDWSVGQVLDALKANGVDDKTLVIFTSDNGPWLIKGEHGGEAGPLREGKGTTFEGGMREPFIARWPGKIQAGKVIDSPAMMIDLLPTLTQLAGGKVPKDRVIDGQDISGLLFGTGHRAHEDFYYFHGEELQAHRSGNWKLKRPFDGKIYNKPAQHPAWLVNLAEDIGEATNLAETNPDVALQLEKNMQAFVESLGDVPETKR